MEAERLRSEPLSPLAQRIHRSAVQLPPGTRRQLLQHAALQHPRPHLRRGEHSRLRHLQIHPGKEKRLRSSARFPTFGVLILAAAATRGQ